MLMLTKQQVLAELVLILLVHRCLLFNRGLMLAGWLGLLFYSLSTGLPILIQGFLGPVVQRRKPNLLSFTDFVKQVRALQNAHLPSLILSSWWCIFGWSGVNSLTHLIPGRLRVTLCQSSSSTIHQASFG